jgi:DNA-binding GntR family transcriptional regulator
MKTPTLRPPAPRLSETAYERILEGLFARRVQVGAFVSQGELSQMFDIPIAPLRDALRMLEGEGVLTIHPRSGIQFVRPGLELTRATYQFRSIVERAAIRVFAETAEDAVLADLTARHTALITAVQAHGPGPDDLAQMDALEQALHGSVIAIMQNPLIEVSYRRMMNYLRLIRLDRNFTSPILLRTLREHLEILQACTRRDADAAEQALQTHLQSAIQRNIGLM